VSAGQISYHPTLAHIVCALLLLQRSLVHVPDGRRYNGGARRRRRTVGLFVVEAVEDLSAPDT